MSIRSLDPNIEFDDEGHRERVFEGLFFRDVEKWFTSDIACCELCVDNFLSSWPLGGLWSDTQFQQSYISMQSFYSGGLTQELFTFDEFQKLVETIPCPNCNEPLKHGFWPFNLPFNTNSEFSDDIEEIGRISNLTPFLVLSNKLATKVFEELIKLSGSVSSENIMNPLYRARLRDTSKSYAPTDFMAPPRSLVKEGRYNHAGKPVLYLANSKKTCWHELREPKEGIVVAQVGFKAKIKTLNLVDKLTIDDNLFQALVWSSLLSSPNEGDGWHKPHYVFSRFLSDCARYAGFDAIIYPSVRKDMGTNLVLLDPEKVAKDISFSDISVFEENI